MHKALHNNKGYFVAIKSIELRAGEPFSQDRIASLLVQEVVVTATTELNPDSISCVCTARD